MTVELTSLSSSRTQQVERENLPPSSSQMPSVPTIMFSSGINSLSSIDNLFCKLFGIPSREYAFMHVVQQFNVIETSLPGNSLNLENFSKIRIFLIAEFHRNSLHSAVNSGLVHCLCSDPSKTYILTESQTIKGHLSIRSNHVLQAKHSHWDSAWEDTEIDRYDALIKAQCCLGRFSGFIFKLHNLKNEFPFKELVTFLNVLMAKALGEKILYKNLETFETAVLDILHRCEQLSLDPKKREAFTNSRPLASDLSQYLIAELLKVWVKTSISLQNKIDLLVNSKFIERNKALGQEICKNSEKYETIVALCGASHLLSVEQEKKYIAWASSLKTEPLSSQDEALLTLKEILNENVKINDAHYLILLPKKGEEVYRKKTNNLTLVEVDDLLRRKLMKLPPILSNFDLLEIHATGAILIDLLIDEYIDYVAYPEATE